MRNTLTSTAALLMCIVGPGLAQGQGTAPSWRARFNGEWNGSSYRPSNGQVSPLRIVLVVTDTSIAGEVYYNNRDFGPLDPGAVIADSVLVFHDGPDNLFKGVIHGARMDVTINALGQDLTASLTKKGAASGGSDSTTAPVTPVPPIPSATAAPPTPPVAQGRHEIVQGRVTTDSGTAIVGADVLVTRTSDRQFKSAVTDSAGRYATQWLDGTGSYAVRIGAPGRQTLQTSVARTQAADTVPVFVFVVDAVLPRGGRVQTLAPIVARAPAAQPPRIPPPFGVDPGAVEGVTAPANAGRRLEPSQAGDLAALSAFALPAALPTGGSFSVLGLSPGQNSTQLNGMNFPGATIPRTARVAVRAASTSWDPSNGWFGGARTNVQMAGAGASLFNDMDAHVTIDLPALQVKDPVATGAGQRYSNIDVSLGGDGRLLDDRFALNYSMQGGHRVADVTSLATADASLLAHAGLSADSATRLLALASQAGIPSTVAGLPGASITDNFVTLGRIDHAPYNWNTLTPASSTWGLVWYGNWNHAQMQGASPLATPGHGGEATRLLGAVQGEYSFYFGDGFLGDVKSGLTYTHNSSDPYLALPDASVRVTSDLPGGTGGVSTLQFGGNAGLHTDQRAWTWESTAELQFYASGNVAHRVKLTADLRRDGSRADLFGNTLGTFSYNSLADLETKTPASFTRTLNAPTRYAGAWNAFVAVGDLWRASNDLQVRYGARVEGNVFTDVPAFNPAVLSAFGARTDHAPNTIHVSPRFGLNWTIPGANNRPAGTVRLGGGEFRNLIDPSLLGNAAINTGLPGGVSRLTCIGASVPTPDWSAYTGDPAAIPTRCVGPASGLADVAPGVTLFDPSFTAEHSWRVNLGWLSNWHGNTYSITGVYSWNLAQHGTTDLNFADLPRFALADEGRPVFANAGDIVPASGLVSAVDARRNAGFARVVNGVSDLRSESRQVTFTVRPNISLSRRIGDPTFSYTLSDVQQQQRGFDAATFGSPAVAEWARGDLDARHQFQMQLVFRPLGDFNFLMFLYGRLQSGLPFTPMIASDVNGDGLANDRAFLYDPAAAPTGALGSQLTTLLASAPSQVRDCLVRQAGHAAARNSCEGPWTAQLNASFLIQPFVSHPDINITINLANPLSGLDQLLHGSNDLRGWGSSAAPNATLYTVQGFDPVAQRFIYQVNPRFGDTRPTNTTLRAPFRLTIDANIDLSREFAAQQVDRWLEPGRHGHAGPKLAAGDLYRRYQRSVPDPYKELLDQSDSLLLTASQQAALGRVDSLYRARMDSTWRQLAGYLSSLPDDFEADEAYKSADAVIDDAWEFTRLDVQRQLPLILSAQQLSELSGWASQFMHAPSRMHQRIFLQG